MKNKTFDNRASVLVRNLTLPVLLIVVWQIWASTLPAGSPAPAPLKVLQTLADLLSAGSLLSATVQSLGRVVLGFALASVLGIALGLLMGSSPAMRENLDPIIESFRPIAPMAILPIAILWLGTGTPTALAIVAYASFFPVLINTVHGVSRVDRKLVLAARTMGISRATILTRVVLPGALPAILLGTRLAMGVAWTAIIAAELAVGAKSGGGGSGGIGQMMFVFYAYNIDLNAIVVCMAVVGVVALLIDQLFRVIEKRLIPWRP
ncbi:ABC transporter permease [Limnohabitans sp.]|jgi:ABC-type nitrate/sulfonate/bicarbonate transport system permease component|uniref:ABC transporter permease n=1 Tax=Limnohabitans sp. TaxID=1907725 RepID=UPI00262D7776|nr:ABC transporter permease [Limnohabitans sp.]